MIMRLYSKGNISWKKRQDGYTVIYKRCPHCRSSKERFKIDTYDVVLKPDENIEDWLRKNSSSDRNSTCSSCSNQTAWNLIFHMYESAYKDDSYRLSVISNIKRLTKSKMKNHPKPSMFKRMMEDRGIKITAKDRGIWNMAADEFKVTTEGRGNFCEIVRWRENDTANSIFSFLGI